MACKIVVLAYFPFCLKTSSDQPKSDLCLHLPSDICVLIIELVVVMIHYTAESMRY